MNSHATVTARQESKDAASMLGETGADTGNDSFNESFSLAEAEAILASSVLLDSAYSTMFLFSYHLFRFAFTFKFTFTFGSSNS